MKSCMNLNHKKNIYILNLTEDGLAISAGLERNNNSVNFISFAKGQPKLFCDFPLIGTEDFSVSSCN